MVTSLNFPKRHPGRLCLGIFIAFIIAMASNSRAIASEDTNEFKWDVRTDKVSADITSWDVLELLKHVAASTGWRIYLDPEGISPVSVKFQDLSSGQALHVLLGKLNFAVVPQTNGPDKLYVYRTSRNQATRMVAPARKIAKPIPNQLVVTLKPGAKTKIEELAKLYGAKVIGRIDGQNAYLLQFDDATATQFARQQLADNPDVASIDNNYPLEAPPAVLSADSTSPDLQLNPKTNTGPCQLVIGLIDTSVQSLGPNLDQFIKPQLSAASQQTADPASQLNHGTAMAETILDALKSKSGGSTSVTIQPVDVYGGSETTSTFDVASGIVKAVNAGANIINLSLGGTGDSQILHDTIINVAKQGIPIYAAAGNTPVTTPTYPAAYPEVTAVTATDSSGNIASYANRGSFVSMTAPGENIVSYNGLQYDVQGTSTATAFVSGMAAADADNAHVCADQAAALLKKSLPQSNLLKASQ